MSATLLLLVTIVFSATSATLASVLPENIKTGEPNFKNHDEEHVIGVEFSQPRHLQPANTPESLIVEHAHNSMNREPRKQSVEIFPQVEVKKRQIPSTTHFVTSDQHDFIYNPKINVEKQFPLDSNPSIILNNKRSANNAPPSRSSYARKIIFEHPANHATLPASTTFEPEIYDEEYDIRQVLLGTDGVVEEEKMSKLSKGEEMPNLSEATEQPKLSEEEEEAKLSEEEIKKWNDEEFKKQAESAKYQFASNVDDGISGNQHHREETRDGLNVKGSYSYSDGYFQHTVHYIADDKGYRIVKQEHKPLGDGPQYNPEGEANIETYISGRQLNYKVKEDDYAKHEKPDEEAEMHRHLHLSNTGEDSI